MTKEKPHLSATQLDMFCRCPEAWRRRYIEKEIVAPRAAMLRGSSIHIAAETNMRQKIESHEDMPAQDIIDLAVSTYQDKIKHESYEIGPGETSRDVERAADTVAAMAEVHARQQAPDYQPQAVEEKFRLELPTSHDIVGVIDLLTDSNEVVDFKTGKRAQSADDADNSTQLSLYAIAVQQKTGSDTVITKLDCLTEPSARTPARRKVIESVRDKTDLPIIAARVAVVSQAIEAGLFPPAAPGSWNCSQAWCGYWSTCKFVNSERITDARLAQEALKTLSKLEPKD